MIKIGKPFVGLMLCLLLIGVLGVSKNQTDLSNLLPDRVAEWSVGEEDRTFGRDNLFDYIDGGAELYLSYGFSKVFSRHFTRPGQPDIIVDVFDMSTSRNAFGVFSHSREAIDDTYGQGSQYTEGLLLFWKDRYYISILASPETEDSKKAVSALAEHIDDAIHSVGSFPEILDLLPRESLVEESIRYFRHYIWLNSHYYIADENILHIDDTTDAVLAKYGEGKERRILLVIDYVDEENARRARADFVKHYAPELAGESTAQIEDGTWIGCWGTQNVLAIVFDAPSREAVLDLLSGVEKTHSARR